MNFEDTPEEAAFRVRCREWLDANAEARQAAPSRQVESTDTDVIQKAKDWQTTKFDAGWACLTWPKEYGGQGLGRMEQVIWNQEEGRDGALADVYLIGHGMLGPTLMAHGTDAQKERFIEKMARGQEIWCQLFSEPSAGSDLAGLRTSAVRSGDDWVINGQKIWTSGAQYSDWGMIVARTDPDAPKHKGLTYFIVNMKSPGVEIRPIKQINGGEAFNEVFFTDVRIPDSQRLGELGQGWQVALTTLMNERVAIGGGAAGGGFPKLLALAERCRRNGRPAIEDGSVRSRLADIYIAQKGIQYTGYRTLSALLGGSTPGPEGAISKAIGAPLGQQIASFAMELEGESGGLLDSAAADGGLWQQLYLGSPGMRIAGGTDEVLRNIIAERVLGLPPELRVDKGIPFRDVPTGASN
ncbi:MAG: acyl-CoA dehydrogenase family protein [bacterium]